MFTKKRKHLIATVTILFLLSIFVPAAVFAGSSALPDNTLIFGGVCEGISTEFLFADKVGAGAIINDLINDPDYNGTVFLMQDGTLLNVWEKRAATMDEIFLILGCFLGYWEDADNFVPFHEEMEYTADLRMAQGFGTLFRIYVDDTNVPDGVQFSVVDGVWESANKAIGDDSFVERFFLEDSFTLNIKDAAGDILKSAVIDIPATDFEEKVDLQ